MSDKTPESNVHNRRAARLRLVRQLHNWVALFVAPSLIFFALTGMVQLFGLHEAEGGYKPLPVIEKLGQVHIHQKYALRPVRRPAAAPAQPAAPAAAPPAEAAPIGLTLVKWTFLLMSAGMAASGVLGIWLAVSNSRQRPRTLVLLRRDRSCRCWRSQSSLTRWTPDRTGRRPRSHEAPGSSAGQAQRRFVGLPPGSGAGGMVADVPARAFAVGPSRAATALRSSGVSAANAARRSARQWAR